MLTGPEKIAVLRSYRTYQDTFVETGTADGHTIYGLRNDFEYLFSIEYGYDEYVRSMRYLMWVTNATVFHGDSAELLPHIMFEIQDHPAVVWLDAHFCGGSAAPRESSAFEELQACLYHPVPHVILIDDARLFGTRAGYPTLPSIEAQLRRAHFRYDMSIEDDIIRLVPDKD